MFLERFALRNFRSFDDAAVDFSPDLTICVGENNAGKSNLIDAIRLLTAPLGGRRELYCETTDIRFGSGVRQFEIDAAYADLSVYQQGRFISATTDDTLEKAAFGLTFQELPGSLQTRTKLWAGRNKSVPEAGCHELVRHVYLPPLRDAKRALASGNPTRIYSLLTYFLGEDDPDDLAKRLKRGSTEPILGKVSGAVEIGLKALTGGVRPQRTALGFATDEKLVDIARDLRFKLADHGIEPEDLRYSGHGYANLLYMATIAVELEKIESADLTLFLVEEPEAHLHPQLQAAVLCFLEEQAEQSRAPKPAREGPAGELQVIVATHSPNLSAWVASKKLVHFTSAPSKSSLPVPASTKADADRAVSAEAAPEKAGAESVGPEDESADAVNAEKKRAEIGDAGVSPEPQGQSRRATQCIPLKALDLTNLDRRKIDRYLDVTKSALLFGGRVLLVEGIAEALLLPIVAKKHVLNGRSEKFRLFRSAVFVPIEGVDFAPYVRLLLTPYNAVRIAERVVVMTDGDKKIGQADDQRPGLLRKLELDAIASKAGASALFETVVSTYSLETELIRAGNHELVKAVYLKLHPQSEEKWNAALAQTGEQHPVAIHQLFETTRKGDFAQLLADEINEGQPFAVPGYIRDAIESSVK